jgi:hypothetical protein
MGLYEIHCHTSEVSVCGRVGAEKAARLHGEAGFEGICITDHYFKGYFDKLDISGWGKMADEYLKGYRIAQKTGDEIGLKVFPAMEIRFPESPNDFLVYGFDEEFIYEHPALFNMGLERFKEFADEKGLLLIQAHPFRDNMTRADSGMIHGMEIVNANPRADSRNHFAKKHAEVEQLIKTGSSDFHREEDLFMASMDFKREINTPKDIVAAIRAGDYKIIENTGKRAEK